MPRMMSRISDWVKEATFTLAKNEQDRAGEQTEAFRALLSGLWGAGKDSPGLNLAGRAGPSSAPREVKRATWPPTNST